MNSTKAISRRTSLGQVTWMGPLTLLAARTGFCIHAQALVTLILVSLRALDPLKAGTACLPALPPAAANDFDPLGDGFVLSHYDDYRGVRETK